MKSKNLSKIRSKVSSLIKNREIIDVVLFGSAIKGKAEPNDIDLAILSDDGKLHSMDGFHVSILTSKEFFSGKTSLAHTLLREGYSLKYNQPFAELFKFQNKVLYTYSLTNFSATKKVQIVTLLRGKNKLKGLVADNGGEWLANRVFVIPIQTEFLIDAFLSHFRVIYTKSYILIH